MKKLLTVVEEEEATRKRHEAEYDVFKTAIKDARYILKQYGSEHPSEALEAIHRILFNPKLHLK